MNLPNKLNKHTNLSRITTASFENEFSNFEVKVKVTRTNPELLHVCKNVWIFLFIVGAIINLQPVTKYSETFLPFKKVSFSQK